MIFGSIFGGDGEHTDFSHVEFRTCISFFKNLASSFTSYSLFRSLKQLCICEMSPGWTETGLILSKYQILPQNLHSSIKYPPLHEMRLVQHC